MFPNLTYVNRFKTVYLLCLLLFFIVKHGTAQSGPDSSPGITLLGSSWQLDEFKSMNDDTGTVIVGNSSEFTMDLWPGGLVIFKVGCNQATGRWSYTPSMEPTSGVFSISELSSTLALCPPPRIDEIVVSQAEYISGYLKKDRHLFLSLMADGGIFKWSYAGNLLESPENGGPQNWETTTNVSLFDKPDSSSDLIQTYPPGTLLDNLGCFIENDNDWWCDVQQLGGGKRGFVSANKLMPAVSPDGSIFRGLDNSAIRAGNGDFDATGSLRCTDESSGTELSCTFGVARAGGGYATVVITKPDGVERIIFFRMGMPIGISSSEADGYPSFNSKRREDMHILHIDDVQYEIPDAIILGG